MKNLYRSIVLGMFMATPMLSGAATFDLGHFPGSAAFGNADPNDGPIAPFNQLPTSGNFADSWNFVVSANNGGSSNVSVTGIGALNVLNLDAVITGAGTSISFLPLFENVTHKIIGVTFGTLLSGNYTLHVNGTANGALSNHSYSGNLTIAQPGETGAVPVPAALWLFGSALVGLMGVSGRKKT